MEIGRGDYFAALSAGGILEGRYVDGLLQEMSSRLTLDRIPRHLFGAHGGQAKITERLSRLPLRVARGPEDWNGLVIGFPGSGEQLTTATLSTPYLREILYPILDLRRRMREHCGEAFPCLYVIGVRFPHLVRTKFRLLEVLIPNIIFLTADLPGRPKPADIPSQVNEQWVQVLLCQKMMSDEGVRLDLEKGEIRLGYLTHELSTGGGTHRRERLDILGLDKAEKALVALEIKGPDCSRVQLENLFLQGLAHREWLERNKRAIKFIFDGPSGRAMDVQKPVRLLLGSFQEEAPDLFWQMREEALERDDCSEIDFVRFRHSGGPQAWLRADGMWPPAVTR